MSSLIEACAGALIPSYDGIDPGSAALDVADGPSLESMEKFQTLKEQFCTRANSIDVWGRKPEE